MNNAEAVRFLKKGSATKEDPDLVAKKAEKRAQEIADVYRNTIMEFWNDQKRVEDFFNFHGHKDEHYTIRHHVSDYNSYHMSIGIEVSYLEES